MVKLYIGINKIYCEKFGKLYIIQTKITIIGVIFKKHLRSIKEKIRRIVVEHLLSLNIDIKSIKLLKNTNTQHI